MRRSASRATAKGAVKENLEIIQKELVALMGELVAE
jgi:hypothetical protein